MIMNKLDSILSKLRGQTQKEYDDQRDQSIFDSNGNQQSSADQSSEINASDQIRINKRKNFTPKIVRPCDDAEKGRLKAVDCLSAADNDLESGPRQLDFAHEERNDSNDGGGGDFELTTFGESNRVGQMEEDHETTPGLAIVETDEDAGVDSERSSSNCSTSVFNADLSSSSVSPNFLLSAITTAFNTIAKSQSPSSNAAILPSLASSNPQRIAADKTDTKSASTIAAAGSTSSDQQSSPVVSYIVRFMGNDCGAEQCRFTTAREHFHCKLCNNKLFTKKEEMLRHHKWHRKREESLAYGFMRYSASDDCSQHFADCVNNLRQTHYHCLQNGCDKVYISTSDVQMHANSHRKQAHIAKEGFRRVKGSEQCAYNACPFADPANRTTHFHCLRPGCTHSFKNKADMDKHKAHHTKDEQLTRDGFKKYMKSEACSFPGCAFSRIVNHIHCIRAGCDYVLHSTSQMYSHKRKHEKQDKRVNDYVAQQRAIANALKNAATLMNAAGPNFSSTSSSPASSNTSSLVQHPNDSGMLPDQFSNNGHDFSDPGDRSSPTAAKKAIASAVQGRLKLKQYDPLARTFHDAGVLDNKEADSSRQAQKKSELLSPKKEETFDFDDVAAMGIDMSTLQSPIQFLKSVTKVDADGGVGNEIEPSQHQNVTAAIVESIHSQRPQTQQINGRSKGDDSWKKYITRYTANDPCVPLCPLLYKDHYHCTAGEGCKMTFKSKDGVRDHAKQHEQLCQAIEHFRECDATEECKIDVCPFKGKELHYHCLWNGCTETIGSSEPVFRRLEHHKVHEYSTQLLNDSRTQTLLATNSTAPARHSSAMSPTHAPPQSDACKRKRGRPPKYNVLDVNVNPSMQLGQNSEILLTSFKLPRVVGAFGPAATQLQAIQQPEQRVSPSCPSRRGRPRTVSSPRHPGVAESPSNLVQPTTINALLQQQQAEHFQQQLDLLRMWNGGLDSVAPSSLLKGARVEAHPVESSKRPQFDGFTTYMASENCPDTLCRYRSQLHFHCRLPRCFYSSSGGDQLETHRRDFHDAFEIPDGYVCYDRSYNCRHTSCQYNGQARHFHCQKAGCSAALLKFNELTAHTSKGHDALNHDQQFHAQHSFPADLVEFGNPKASSSNVVRTTGIFFPGSSTISSSANGSNNVVPSSFGSQRQSLGLNPATFAALAQSISPAFALFNAALGIGGATLPNLGTPNGLASGNALPYTVEQQCGRPFCKLKRRLHYHCTLCHQGFSHFDRLTVHMQKHGIVLPPLLTEQPTASTVSPHVKAAVQAAICDQQRFNPVSNHASQNVDTKIIKTEATLDLKRSVSPSSAARTAQASKKVKFHVFQPKEMKFDTKPKLETIDSSIASVIDKPAAPTPTVGSPASRPRTGKPTKIIDPKPTIQVSGKNANPMSPVQLKFVDCISDVNDSISKLVRPTTPTFPSTDSNSGRYPPVLAPYLQLETANRPSACVDDSCPRLSRSQIHYHCEKCDFWTPESTKWHMHVKQHARMDQVAALGFRKVLAGATNDSNDLVKGSNAPGACLFSDGCSLANQSHYHCLMCSFAALNQSQMSAHKSTKHPDLDSDHPLGS